MIKPQFINSVHLCGVVESVLREHINDSDLSSWKIIMYTEHHYVVDNFNERSFFVVRIFPDVECYRSSDQPVGAGDWVSVEGRMRTTLDHQGRPMVEIIANELLPFPQHHE